LTWAPRRAAGVGLESLPTVAKLRPPPEKLLACRAALRVSLLMDFASQPGKFFSVPKVFHLDHRPVREA
jgi:hypothetical protein